jgi:hypothetical protein
MNRVPMKNAHFVIQRAPIGKENTFESSLALENARAAERTAVRDYEDHVKKHGCKL